MLDNCATYYHKQFNILEIFQPDISTEDYYFVFFFIFGQEVCKLSYNNHVRKYIFHLNNIINI